MKDAIGRPALKVVRRVLEAGTDAGRVAAEAGQRATANSVARYVEGAKRTDPAVDVEDLVDRIVRAHVMLARAEGAAAGLATSTAEVTTAVGTAGALTFPTAVMITATDLTGLLWIQLRMVLAISALYGHDPRELARAREFLALQGVPAPVVAPPVEAAVGRVLTRLLKRYLRGPLLASITSLFGAVGVRFSRAAVLRQVFLVNIPVNALVSDAATRRLGHKARDFYRTLPPGVSVGVERA